MVATVGSISIDLATNAAKFATGFRSSATTVERESARMGRAAQAADQRIAAMGRTAVNFLGGGLAARQLAQYADTWTQAGNQIRAASEISGMQGRSLEDLNDIATETRSGLKETVDLYAKLLRAGKDVAKSEREIATATEIVNKAFKAGGAATSEQIAGVLQLSQALGSGILQGDELRSIRENAPLLAQAIADEFGTSIGGLKELGAAGQLTSERVFKAILRGQKDIDAAFAQTQSTISDAITNLGNATIQAVGKLDQATGASAAFKDEINLLAKAIQEFGNTPGLDQFLNVFGLKLAEGGLADQARDLFNGISEESARAASEVEADIARVKAVLEDLRAQSQAGFDVALQTDRAQEDLKALQEELARVGTAAAAAAANGTGALNALAASAVNAMNAAAAVASKPLPNVTRYGGGDPIGAPTKPATQEVNGVRVTRYGQETAEATTRSADTLDNLANQIPSGLDDLASGIWGVSKSLNDLPAGIGVHFASIADGVRVGIVSGLAQQNGNNQYTISTGSGTKGIEAQIEKLRLVAATVGTIAAQSIQQQIAELELQKYQMENSGSSFSYGGKFAEGGSFVVGGNQTGDSNLVTLLANEGERVSVTKDGGGQPIVLNYHAAAGESERTARQNARAMLEMMQREQARQ